MLFLHVVRFQCDGDAVKAELLNVLLSRQHRVAFFLHRQANTFPQILNSPVPHIALCLDGLPFLDLLKFIHQSPNLLSSAGITDHTVFQIIPKGLVLDLLLPTVPVMFHHKFGES